MKYARVMVMSMAASLAAGAADAGKWTLAWSEEFNGEGLVDGAVWNYERGFIRNREAQYYTAGRAQNVAMRGGNLVITARKEDFSENGQDAKYTSGSINTKGKKAFHYGRIEVRAKLPVGQGNWPAIWMMGVEGGWPRGGEIDIMEHVWASKNTVHATVHWSDKAKAAANNNNGHTSKGSKIEDQKPYEDFHVYAVEWDADKMAFFMDDAPYFTFTISDAGEGADNPFRKPHYLLLNLAIGGSWGGAIDDAIFPCEYLIDYVRHYVPAGGIIAPGAKVEKLADGFKFTEGPIADKDGNVYFTDQPNDKILIWTVDGKLSTLGSFGRANGMYFDRDGRLLTCSDMDNELWSVGMDGTKTVLVADYNGKKLNGPNDVWVNPKDGSVYFTDPFYKRPYWTRDPAMQQAGEYVFLLKSDRKTLLPVDTEMKQPNGIIGTPDGKTLYVADIGGNKTYAYDIQPDGLLSNRRLFCAMGSDGMTIDTEGNVYLTGKGVTVFNAKGEQIEHIPIEAGWTANVCFGGKDRKTLFITASQYLYALRMRVPGAM